MYIKLNFFGSCKFQDRVYFHLQHIVISNLKGYSSAKPSQAGKYLDYLIAYLIKNVAFARVVIW